MPNTTWFRVYTDITRDRKIRRLPIYARWVWITILCMAKESPVEGSLLLSEDIPISIEDIADEAGVTIDEVQDSLNKFKELHMVYEDSNGVLVITNWHKRQFESDMSSERVRRYRERSKKEDEVEINQSCNDDVTFQKRYCNGDVTFLKRYSNGDVTLPDTDNRLQIQNTDTDINNINISRSSKEDRVSTSQQNQQQKNYQQDNNTDSEEIKEIQNNREQIPYREIVDIYNNTCVSLPKVEKLTDKRRRHIKRIWLEFKDIRKIQEIFQKAEESDFLSGRSGRWSGCSFDWLINVNNAIKVLEGHYTRAAPTQQNKTSQERWEDGLKDDPYARFYIMSGPGGDESEEDIGSDNDKNR